MNDIQKQFARFREIAALDEVGRPEVDCELEPVDENGDEWFHPGQKEAWRREERIVAIIAGNQSGKTVWGPYALLREIQRTATPIKSLKDKPNDYLIAGPSITLLKRKCFQAFLTVFGEYGKMNLADNYFTFSPEGSRKLLGYVTPITVFFGHAANPESLESMTAKAVWLDEAGQEGFKLQSYRAVQRRLSTTKGRIFITTTPYTLGWLKEEVHDRAVEGVKGYALINFKTVDNPTIAEDEEAMEIIAEHKKSMPPWQYRMFYEGVFTRPAGAIYDCFDPEVGGRKGDTNVCEPFDIPKKWPRLLGQDFGEVNMGSVFLAEDPDSDFVYVYGTRLTGNKSVQQHADEIKLKAFSLHCTEKPEEFELLCGGSWSEQDCRTDFIFCGLDITRPPIKEVEVGILRVYRMLVSRRLKFFSTCTKLITEVRDYSREVDVNGEPTLRIADKEKKHRADSLRYICAKRYPSADVEITQGSRYEDPGPPEKHIDLDEEEEAPKRRALRRVI